MTLPSILYAVPKAPPPPPIVAFRGLTHTWTGWDGSVWRLSDPSGGVLFIEGALGGLGMPTFQRYVDEPPSVSGGRWRGARTQAREVDWPLLIWSDDSTEEWLARDRAFWRTMTPDGVGTWTVTLPDGTRRSLDLRYIEGGQEAHESDPFARGWAVYTPRLLAVEPYWRGDPIVRSWETPAPVEFFDPNGSPGFHISSTATTATATLDNPGDVGAWPVLTFTGPLTDVTVSIGGGELGIPDLAAGQTLVVDTDPRRAIATRNGVDVSGLVDPWDARPVPAGRGVELGLQMTGSGSASVSIVPRYFRAW